MSSPYVFTLDGTAFSSYGKHTRGPVIYHQPQRWSEMHPLGHTGSDATILTFTGLESQKWGLQARCTTAEKDKLLSVYNGRIAVVWKTPQDATGVNVVMIDLRVQYDLPIENSLFLCDFTLVRR